jgi:predicted nucleic acid-binding protein
LTIYTDSSFIASLYLFDGHLSEARRRMAQQPTVWLTQFNRTEFAHALGQYEFRGTISSHEADKVWRNFQKDCRQGIWIPVILPEQIWETSIDLARRYGPTLGVCTLDSLHVACALELRADKFWTFDERQAKLAEAVGLDTNP